MPEPENPLFSVVIPTYNRSARLKTALESVLRQTYTNFEVIIVDDGGKDDTEAMVESLNDSRLKYFWKENEERSIARNFGIGKAKGRYINFLDSDDLQYPDHLEHAASRINAGVTEIFHASFEYVNDKGKTLNQIIIREVSLEKLFEHNFLHCNAIFIRSDIVKQVHFLNSRHAILSEDHYLWLRLAARYKFLTSEKVTSAVVEHEARSLNEINPDKAWRNYQVLFESLEQDLVLMSAENKSGLMKVKASKYIFNGLCYVLRKENKRAAECLKIAAGAHFPFVFHYRFWVVVKKMAENTVR